MNKKLALNFEKEMREMYKHAKEKYKCNSARFLQMINQYDGGRATKGLIKNRWDTGELSDGFTNLWNILFKSQNVVAFYSGGNTILQKNIGKLKSVIRDI